MMGLESRDGGLHKWLECDTQIRFTINTNAISAAVSASAFIRAVAASGTTLVATSVFRGT